MSKKTFLIAVLFNMAVIADIPFPGRGINICDYLQKPKNMYKSIDFTEADIKRIADAGFDNVRIPARFSDYITNDSLVEPEFMIKYKWLVDETLKNNMVAIVDVHDFVEMTEDAEKYYPVLVKIWEHLIEEFKDYPDSSVLFEVMNEPNGATTTTLWNKYSHELIDLIRKTNPTRPILLASADWGGFNSLKALDIPDDPNIIITLHYYNPMKLTHQGAEWVTGADAWLGTTWEGTPEQILIMEQDFRNVAEYAKQKSLRIHIGEFGVYIKAKYEDRVRWSEIAVAMCKKFGFAFSYWGYFSSYGIYDEWKGEWRKELLDAMFSDKVIPDTTYTLSDENIIKDPNFTQGSEYWQYGAWGRNTIAKFSYNEGLQVHVSQTDDTVYNIQALQDNLPLEDGKIYELSFDVAGDNTMYLYAGVQSSGDWINFGGMSVGVPSKQNKVIVKAEPTNNPVRLYFDMGYTTGTAVIQNVSLREIVNPTVANIQPPRISDSHRAFIRKNIIHTSPFAEIDVISANGKVISSGISNKDGRYNIKNMPKGVYFVRVKSIITMKYLQK